MTETILYTLFFLGTAISFSIPFSKTISEGIPDSQVPKGVLKNFIYYIINNNKKNKI